MILALNNFCRIAEAARKTIKMADKNPLMPI
jgi:hypothetical protein